MYLKWCKAPLHLYVDKSSYEIIVELHLRLFGHDVSIYYIIHHFHVTFFIFDYHFVVFSAQMGVSEGKSVGEWFGPNTVAQVLKKLSTFDEFTPYCVHVAMDNTVVVDDVYALCKGNSVITHYFKLKTNYIEKKLIIKKLILLHNFIEIFFVELNDLRID